MHLLENFPCDDQLYEKPWTNTIDIRILIQIRKKISAVKQHTWAPCQCTKQETEIGKSRQCGTMGSRCCTIMCQEESLREVGDMCTELQVCRQMQETTWKSKLESYKSSSTLPILFLYLHSEFTCQLQRISWADFRVIWQGKGPQIAKTKSTTTTLQKQTKQQQKKIFFDETVREDVHSVLDIKLFSFFLI